MGQILWSSVGTARSPGNKIKGCLEMFNLIQQNISEKRKSNNLSRYFLCWHLWPGNTPCNFMLQKLVFTVGMICHSCI